MMLRSCSREEERRWREHSEELLNEEKEIRTSPRELLGFHMACLVWGLQKYVRLLRDTFESHVTVVTSAGGGQGVGISPEPLLVAMVMDGMTDVTL